MWDPLFRLRGSSLQQAPLHLGLDIFSFLLKHISSKYSLVVVSFFFCERGWNTFERETFVCSLRTFLESVQMLIHTKKVNVTGAYEGETVHRWEIKSMQKL